MENNVSHALLFLEEEIQYICLTFMAIMYAIKIVTLLKKPVPPEKAELKGDRVSGAFESLLNVLRPWSMESSRNNMFMYWEFMIFHVAVALTIGATFLIPLAPQVMTPTVTVIFMIFMALAFLIGLRRIHRRLTVPEIRIISSPDDYFAIILMTVFFATGVIALYFWLYKMPETAWMWIFFLMTTFFLLYVPFSKISHYILYPFGRVNFGRTFGGRGVINKKAKDTNWNPTL